METSPLRPLVYSLFLLAGCGGGAELILPGDGEPAAIAVVDGDDQSGKVGEPLAHPVVFQVTDSRGRPVEGAAVAFDVTSTPGADIVPVTGQTNSEGLVNAQVVLGRIIGRQTGEAHVVTGEGRQPIATTFSATALPENANSMAAVGGQDQSGHVGQPLADRLVVEVTDEFGNPVSGIPISWSVEGGGSVSETLVTTGDDGRARVDRILGPAVGPQATIATSEGLAGSPVTFAHTAVAGDASRLVVVAGNEQTATVGSTLPVDLVVQLVDPDGNGVPGMALSWVVAVGGGTATPQNTTTDDQGRATTRWTLGGGLGFQRIDAVVSGVGFISFIATATASTPPSLVMQTQPSNSAQNGVPFERQPVVQLRDASGTDQALAGVEVRVGLGSGGGELLGTLLRSTDAAGRATFTDLAISGDAGSRTLQFEATGYAGVSSTAINVAAPPVTSTTTTITSDSPDPSSAGSVITVVVQVTSSAGPPTGSVTVTVSGSTPPPPCTVALSNGTGTCQFTLNIVGDRLFTATYSGSPQFGGSQDTEPHVVIPATPDNEPPDADFNWDCEGLTCHFTDASHDRDGTIVSRNWSLGDGGSSSEVNPSHTYSAPGTYSVTLTVTDDDGATGVSGDDVDPQAQVLEIRRQPSATATVGEPFDTQPEIQLRAGGRDLKTGGVSITASIASGSGTLGGTTTVATDGDGKAKFENLSISGATGTHTLRFTATGFNDVVSNGIDVRKVGSDIHIESDAPDPSVSGEAVTVQFKVEGKGGPPTGTVTVTVSGGTESCSAPVANGSCVLTLTTTGDRDITATYSGDARFEGDSDTEGHRVNAPNQPPSAAFSSGCSNLDCSFNSSASSDPDGSISSRSWDFGDGAVGSATSPSHTYAAGGSYTVTLTVLDNDGASDTEVQTVTVSAPNAAPTAAFTAPSCTTGQSCQFTDASSDTDGFISTWNWSFNDGGSSDQQNPSHIFLAPGDYQVTLTVTDNEGLQDSATQTVTVS